MKFLKTLLYSSMRSFARFSIARKKPYVIGITGSVGKTSCRMIITEVLQQQLPTLSIYSSPSNYNSELGLALSILAIENFSNTLMGWIRTLMTGFLRAIKGCRYNVLVLEYGIDYPGEMEIELSIVKPDLAIFTSVDSVHAHQLGSKEGILKEKSKLLCAAKDCIAYPVQSSYIEPYILPSHADQLRYSLLPGEHQNAHIYWDQHQFITNTTIPQVQFTSYLGNESTIVQTGLMGTEHAAYITLALQITQIIAIRKNINYTLSKILSIKGSLQPGRYTLFEGIGESILIDSSYNGAPQSMRLMIKNALHLRKQCYPTRPLRLVMGEMRELGDFCKDEHESFAHYIAELDVEKYYLVGQSMKDYVVPILEKVGKKIVWDTSSRTLGEILKNELSFSNNRRQQIPNIEGSAQRAEGFQSTNSESVSPLILFKGSQNTIFLEEAVKILLKNPEDEKLLCRQSKEWMWKKEKWFGSITKK